MAALRAKFGGHAVVKIGDDKRREGAGAGSYTAATTQTSPTATTENLTFSGSLFGTTPITLAVPQNSDHTAIINLINNDSRLNTLLEASDDGSGHLKITSKKQGTPGNFSVSSDQPNTTGGAASAECRVDIEQCKRALRGVAVFEIGTAA